MTNADVTSHGRSFATHSVTDEGWGCKDFLLVLWVGSQAAMLTMYG